jgi:2,3-diketo-5-methylthio-1-phosphopentane phosphatase
LNIAILSDFDETITSENILNQLYKRFASPIYKNFIERWNNGEISTQEEIEGCFATVKKNRAEMEAYLSEVTIDPGFSSLFNYCNGRKSPLVIVSDGLRWYIDYILQNNNIHDVRVYANEIYFEPSGFRFDYPWFDDQSPLQGTSKKKIVLNYQQLGYAVFYIGDGLSDTGAAEAADVLFSRDYLTKYARDNNLETVEYSELSDVLDHLRYIN